MKEEGFISELNENYRFKKIKIGLISILIISIGTILLFFQDYISHANKKLRSNVANNLFIKWILIGFVINILILISIFIIKDYRKKNTGSIGMIGIRGIKGKRGEDCIVCVNDEINNDDYNFNINKNFDKNKWKKI